MPLSCLAFSWLIQCHPEWFGIRVCKYLTEYYFLHVHMSYYVLLACHFIVYLDSSVVKFIMAVNLCAAYKKTDSHAAHKVLLACFLQSYSTQRWILCSARNIAHMLYSKVNSRITHEFGLSQSTKIEEHMCVPRTRVST